MRLFSFEILEDALTAIYWNEYYRIPDPSECWNYLYTKILGVLDDLYPEKTMNNVKKKSKSLFELMRLRDEKFRLAKLTKDTDIWTEAKNYHYKVNESCDLAKSEFVQGKLHDDAGDPRKFGKHIRPLFSDTSKGSKDKNEIYLDGQESVNSVPEIFNNFFTQIGMKLKNEIQPLDESELQKLTAAHNPGAKTGGAMPCNTDRFHFRKILDIELIELIKGIQVHKASGIPRISTFLLKQSFKNPLIRIIASFEPNYLHLYDTQLLEECSCYTSV